MKQMKKLLLLIGFLSVTTNAQVKNKIIAKPKSQTASKFIKINNYEWMASNLNEKKFRNGDVIPQAQSKDEWAKASRDAKPAWCYYQIEYSKIKKHGDPSTGLYGVLYNWYAVNDSRKLAPVGWHIPSTDEWHDLFNYFGELNPGTSKEIVPQLISTKYWNDGYSENYYGTNSSGFNALPGGERRDYGMFNDIGTTGIWWCSNIDNDGNVPYHIEIRYGDSISSKVYDDGVWDDTSILPQGWGMSVRCIKD